MKLTLKCLIDFRSWLGENHDMRMWEFNYLPEPIQNAYMMMFLDIYDLEYTTATIVHNVKIYNNKFENRCITL